MTAQLYSWTRCCVCAAIALAVIVAVGSFGCSPPPPPVTTEEHTETAYLNAVDAAYDGIDQPLDHILTLFEEYGDKPYGKNSFSDASWRKEARDVIAKCDSAAKGLEEIPGPPERLKKMDGFVRTSGRELRAFGSDFGGALDTEPPAGSKWDIDKATKPELLRALDREKRLMTAADHYTEFQDSIVRFLDAYSDAFPDEGKQIRHRMAKIKRELHWTSGGT